MLNQVLKNNKNYIYIFIISILLILNFIYYFSNENNTQTIQNSDIKDIKNQINNNSLEKIIKNHKIEILENKNEIIPQKKIKNLIVLFSALCENGKYSLKFISNKEIDSQKSTTLYIPITGNIVDKDSDSNIFSLSLDENYIYNLNNISLEITNIETKEINSCDGNFLNTVLPEFSYHMQIDIKENFAHCYIKSQSEPKNSINIDNKLMNDLGFDKNMIIQDKTFTDEKGLENPKDIIENDNNEAKEK
jgi:hypothetical protein